MKIIDKTTFRFVLVGVLNTLVGTGVMFFMYNILHLNYWVSSASNYIVGSILSYFLNKYFTFENKTKSVSQVVRFIINISACYLLAYGIAKPVSYKLFSFLSKNLCENIAMLVGMGLFVVLNYFGQKFLVFKKEEKAEK